MTCAKQVVRAVLTGRSGKVYVGENLCGMPQTTCPRLPGEGYAKCKSICMQPRHAEIDALLRAGDDAEGGSIVVHYTRVCDDCMRALDAAGVAEVRVSP
jgi:deoxycytidylate deaminase